jgi:phosphoribosylformimino-5-aminoimidazole carboxamide ribonucleotide (ProFAR) isomerase
VGTLEDLRALCALEGGGRRLAGIIAGRAIYEGRFTVEQGLATMVEAG